MHQLTEKIESFWEWFQKMEPQYRKFFTDEPVNTELLVEAMNNRVLDFGQFKWEMREGKQGVLQFIISPNGDYDLFEISKQIIRHQPSHLNWEFLPALPPQKTDYKFKMYDQAMHLIDVDGSNWQCVLEKEDDLVIAIFEISNLINLEFDSQIEAAEILLKKIIGEEKFIEHIGGLEVVDEFDETEDSFPIQEFVLKFDEMVGS